jgi:phosphatidylserine/phosphatidylglycerophosphate/cardiolipin synthase-like enzyme
MIRIREYKLFLEQRRNFPHRVESESYWRRIIGKVSDKFQRDFANSVLDTIMNSQQGFMSAKQKAILDKAKETRFPNLNSFQMEILRDLESAQQFVKVAVSWLTDRALINGLIDAAKRGVEVKVVISGDDFNNIRSKEYLALAEAGGILKKMGSASPEEGNFMHCKFYVIDDKLAKSGSFNWTLNGSVNYETLDTVPVEPKMELFEKVFELGNEI